MAGEIPVTDGVGGYWQNYEVSDVYTCPQCGGVIYTTMGGSHDCPMYSITMLPNLGTIDWTWQSEGKSERELKRERRQRAKRFRE